MTRPDSCTDLLSSCRLCERQRHFLCCVCIIHICIVLVRLLTSLYILIIWLHEFLRLQTGRQCYKGNNDVFPSSGDGTDYMGCVEVAVAFVFGPGTDA